MEESHLCLYTVSTWYPPLVICKAPSRIRWFLSIALMLKPGYEDEINEISQYCATHRSIETASQINMLHHLAVICVISSVLLQCAADKKSSVRRARPKFSIFRVVANGAGGQLECQIMLIIQNTCHKVGILSLNIQTLVLEGHRCSFLLFLALTFVIRRTRQWL